MVEKVIAGRLIRHIGYLFLLSTIGVIALLAFRFFLEGRETKPTLVVLAMWNVLIDKLLLLKP
jgi:hypothetical protein